MAKIGKGSGYQEIRGKLAFFVWVWRIMLAVWQVAMIGWIVSYAQTIAPMVAAAGAKGTGSDNRRNTQRRDDHRSLGRWHDYPWSIRGLSVLLTRRTKANLCPFSESGYRDCPAKVRGTVHLPRESNATRAGVFQFWLKIVLNTLPMQERDRLLEQVSADTASLKAL